MSATRLARFAGVAAVLASTAVVSTGTDASAAISCPHGATFMVTVKAGVYSGREYPTGRLVHFIKYKYPGDIVDGSSLDGGSYLVVRLGGGGAGYMRGDKAVFNGCY